VKVLVSGATGLLGRRVVRALVQRGDEVTALSRDPARARGALGVEVSGWDPEREPAPATSLAGRDAVVHLAGEPLDQRWSDAARQRIMRSREVGTRNLVAGLLAAEPRPRVLVSASAVGWYGARGDEQLQEDARPGSGFLSDVCQTWEREAAGAAELGVRVVQIRTGVVLDADGGALKRMLPFFRLGVGGPVAGGRQYLSWIHLDDVVGIYLAALDDERFEGPVNATAPEPVTNRELARALGRVLRRPAVMPVPGIALRALYGDMAELVVDGHRVVPAKAQRLGYAFQQPQLESALRRALR
jgi:uncharacterized protein (TIGR01777 family)